jgi:probable rRNA maturation factor
MKNLPFNERRAFWRMKLKVMIKDGQKRASVPAGMKFFIRKCCHAVLECEGFGKDAEVSVSLVDNAEMRRLNNSFRNIDEPTDVLSFPLCENGVYDINSDTGACLLGDIVISVETAVRQAELCAHSLEREVGFLTVHSMLHLLGYDHETAPFQAALMREKEELILEKLGVARDSSFV